MTRKEYKFGEKPLSAIADIPGKSKWMYIMAHGAGAGMMHRGMEAISQSLNEMGIATFRYNFPYMEEGRRSPGSPKQAINAVVEAVSFCKSTFPDHQLAAGGKSYGGRMTSTAASTGLIPDVKSIVFYGFPLHAPGRPGNQRAEHLYEVKQPMLFLQGTRDKLAELDLLQPVIDEISAQIYILDGADHSFNVLKSNPKTKEEVLAEMAGKVREFLG